VLPPCSPPVRSPDECQPLTPEAGRIVWQFRQNKPFTVPTPVLYVDNLCNVPAPVPFAAAAVYGQALLIPDNIHLTDYPCGPLDAAESVT
jgi:hypothetical protein